jgi:Tfp pilus assembly protein PilV
MKKVALVAFLLLAVGVVAVVFVPSQNPKTEAARERQRLLDRQP